MVCLKHISFSTFNKRFTHWQWLIEINLAFVKRTLQLIDTFSPILTNCHCRYLFLPHIKTYSIQYPSYEFLVSYVRWYFVVCFISNERYSNKILRFLNEIKSLSFPFDMVTICHRETFLSSFLKVVQLILLFYLPPLFEQRKLVFLFQAKQIPPTLSKLKAWEG